MASNWGVDKDRADLLRRAKKAGCRVEHGSHAVAVYGPDGRFIGSTPSSKCGPKTWNDLRSKLRRAGVRI